MIIVIILLLIILFLVYKAETAERDNTIICCWSSICAILLFPAIAAIANLLYTNGLVIGLVCSMIYIALAIVFLKTIQFLIRLVINRRIIFHFFCEKIKQLNSSKNRYIATFVMVILLGVSVHYFFQPRYIIQNGMCYPHSRQFSCHLLELKMNLDEIEEIYPNFTAPCAGGEHYLFTEPEAIDKLVSITKLTMGKLLWYLTLKKYWCCDYSSNERNKLPTSHFFGRLPGKGTYLKNGEFFEISDNGFSLVIDVIDDVPIYRLKSEYDPISISNLDKGHFQYYKTIRKGGDYIRKRISLPFGTYLYPWGNSYYIISVLPN